MVHRHLRAAARVLLLSSCALVVTGPVTTGPAGAQSPRSAEHAAHGSAAHGSAAHGSVAHGSSAHWSVRMRDLGTLGGRSSGTRAVSGSVVVGWSEVGPANGGGSHAFAYDLAAPQPHMVDVGPAGHNSVATDVDDGVVVGWYKAGAYHAFAYDLRSPTPHVVDLGSLVQPQGWNIAYAVDDGVVVGTSWGDHEAHAFMYDLRAAQPHMVDLGSLPGGSSGAYAVSGRRAGGASGPADEGFPVVFDLDAPGSVTPLVTGPSAQEGSVTALAGDLAVGYVDYGVPFYEDLSAPQPRPVVLRKGGEDLQLTDGRFVVTGDFQPQTVVDTRPEPDRRLSVGITANAISQGVAVGWAYGMLTPDALAFDLTAPRFGATDLGRPAWADLSAAEAIDGATVAGTAYGRTTKHAVVWLLGRPSGTTVALTAQRQRLVEGTTARIEVRRTGSARSAATVGYVLTAPGSGQDGSPHADVARDHGRVRFAPGRRTAWIRVRVVADGVTEPVEHLLVHLRSPEHADLGRVTACMLDLAPAT